MNCIFLGPPGAGKGTLAYEVSKEYEIPHISTGDLFRAAIKNETELGKKVKAVLAAGDLVSDDLTIAIVKERLEQSDAKAGFILDGFPRTIAQADALQDIVKIDSVVNFDVNDDEVIKRLSGRRMCSGCGQSFHIEFMKPKKEGVCDSCGKELITRPDDKIEAIKNRLATYREQTAPLIDYYSKKDLTVDIDAKPPADEVLNAFRKKFPKAK